MSGPLLALEHVHKVYRRGVLDRTPAFELAVDHRFEHPEIVGVMGPNGAGKTTLFEMIAGSNAPATPNPRAMTLSYASQLIRSPRTMRARTS